MRGLSVSSIHMIICHEFSHCFLNYDIDDEFEADRNGWKIYLASGHMPEQALYGFLRIFNPKNGAHEARANVFFEMLKEHKQEIT